MIAVLTGPVRSGKTTFLLGAVSRWKEAGRPVVGFLSRAVESGRGTEYELLDIAGGRAMPFLTRADVPGAERVGRYSFIPSALDAARTIIASSVPGQILVVDEVGPRELRGGGVWPAVGAVLAEAGRTVLVTVRETILRDFLLRIGPRPTVTADVRDPLALARLEEALFGPPEGPVGTV